jgi:hypothetical protein
VLRVRDPRRPPSAYAGGVLKLLLVVAVFAVVTYLAVRAMQGAGAGPTPTRSTRPKPAPPRRPVAPDDDEDFLRDLDRKRLNPPDDGA